MLHFRTSGQRNAKCKMQNAKLKIKSKIPLIVNFITLSSGL